MRSRPSSATAFILLSFATVGLAACESDSGGGDTVASTSSGGDEVGELPDEGSILVRDWGESWDARGYFMRGQRCTNDDGAPWTDPEIGTCEIRVCEFDVSSLSAGEITVGGSPAGVKLSLEEEYAEYRDEGRGEVFSASPLTFSAAGDEVPDFFGSVSTPGDVANVSFGGDDVTIEAGEDMTVTWDPPAGGDVPFQVRLQWTTCRGDDCDDDSPDPEVVCAFDVRAGQGVVPYEVMSAHPELKPSGAAVVTTHTSVVGAGTFRVSLTTERYVGGARWFPPALVCDSGVDLTGLRFAYGGEGEVSVYDVSGCLTERCCDVVSACQAADPDACLDCFTDPAPSPLCDPVHECMADMCGGLQAGD